MPYDLNAPRLDHLPLIREDLSADRRKRKPPPPPARGSRTSLGNILISKISAIGQHAKARSAPAPGVKPHLVFRVPLAPGGSLEIVRQRLEESGLTIVSIEPEGAIIAFREDADRREFRGAVEAYQRGPRGSITAPID
jgi:hypothetical protein